MKKEFFFYIVLFITFSYSIFHSDFLNVLYNVSLIISIAMCFNKGVEFLEIFFLSEGFQIIVPKNKYAKKKLEEYILIKIINLISSAILISVFCFFNKWNFSFYMWGILACLIFSVDFVKLNALKKINIDNI